MIVYYPGRQGVPGFSVTIGPVVATVPATVLVDSAGAEFGTAGNPFNISGSISATNPSVGTTGATAPTSATEMGWINGSGNLVGVSAANPLPISGSISATNPSVGATGAATPASATEIGWDDAGTLRAASAAKPLPVSGSFLSAETVLNVTGTIASAAVLSNFPIANTAGYRSAAVQVTNAGTTCTLVAEQSNDGTTWTGLQSVGDTIVEAPTPMIAVGMYVFNITALQFRVRCSVYGSGNPAVNVELRQITITPSMASYLTLINTTLGTPLQAGGNVVVTGTVPLPTGAATAALQTTGNTALTTINTTLGSPFQAGGSIGNTAFGISGTLPAFGATPTFNLGTLNGAATAAKQPALGTAGTASADVISVQGIASMTALKVDGSGVTQPVSGTVTANLGTIAGVATSALQTTGNTSLGTIDTSTAGILTTLGLVTASPVANTVQDRLKTIATNTAAATPAGTNIIGRVGIDQTTPGTTNLVALAANQSVNNAQFNGVAVLMGSGATGAGSQRVTAAIDAATAAGTPPGQQALAASIPVAIASDQLTANKLSAAQSTTGNTSVAVTNFPAVAAKRNYVTSIHVGNTSATPVTVKLQDDNGGTTIWEGIVPAGGGIVESAGGGTPLCWTTVNKPLYFQSSAAASTIYVNLAGFLGA